MALKTKSEFAFECVINSNHINTYLKKTTGIRIVATPDGMIDTNDPINAKFLAKRVLFAKKKGRKVEESELKEAKIAKKEGENKAKGGENTANAGDLFAHAEDFETLERLKMQLQAEELREKISKLRLGNQKSQGEFAKVDQVEAILDMYYQGCRAATEVALDDLIMVFTQKHQLTREEIIFFKAEKTKAVNRLIERAMTIALNKLKKAKAELSQQRGVG